MQEKWEYIVKTYGSGFLVTRFVSSVVSPVCISFASTCFVPFWDPLSGMFDYHDSFFLFLLVQFASFEKAKEVEEFFASHPMPAIARTLKQSLEQVYINANWVKSVQNEKSIADAIQELAYRKY